MNNLKSQVAYEFIFVFFTLTLGFTVWIMFSAALQDDFHAEKLSSNINDFGLSLQDTLYTAVQMPDGFSRTFVLPATIMGYDYSLVVHDMSFFSMVDVVVDDNVFSFKIPLVKGDFVKGTNNLVVNNGVVCLNGAC